MEATSIGGTHTESVCMSEEKNVEGACQGVVPVIAERAGMFEWSGGSTLWRT